jgi:hypothetical protein
MTLSMPEWPGPSEAMVQSFVDRMSAANKIRTVEVMALWRGGLLTTNEATEESNGEINTDKFIPDELSEL